MVAANVLSITQSAPVEQADCAIGLLYRYVVPIPQHDASRSKQPTSINRYTPRARSDHVPDGMDSGGAWDAWRRLALDAILPIALLTCSLGTQ